jgi:protein involved in polysaccharide export with SLBB domain
MLAASPAAAQGFGSQQGGTLGSLLQQLQQLQSSGQLDRGGGAVTSPVDTARGSNVQQQQQQAARPNAALGAEPRLGIAGLNESETLLVQQFCRGELEPEQAETVELIRNFSRVERDYCRRAGEVLIQFGYDGFSQTGRDPDLSTGAVSPDYVLGVGDELVITFHGGDSRTYTTRVDREGRVVIPEWAPIPAAGRTFREFQREVEARTAVTKLGTEAFVSLGSLRSISITVAGEVNEPGRYQLTSLSTIIDALASARGIKKSGSLRRIQLQRGSDVHWFDYYELLQGVATAANRTLRDGDRIVVPVLGLTVAAGGDVRRPAIYELAERRSSISLRDLLDLAGGPLRPRGNSFVHISIDPSGKEQVTERTDMSTAIRAGDILLTTRREDIQVGSVEIVGHVRVPGRRSLASAPTLSRLLGDASSLKRDPYLLFAALETTDPQTQARRLFPVNLQNILSGRQDYSLRDGDRLIVLSADDIRFLSSSDVQRIITNRLQTESERVDAAFDPRAEQRQAAQQSAGGQAAAAATDPRLAGLQQLLGPQGQGQAAQAGPGQQGPAGQAGAERDQRGQPAGGRLTGAPGELRPKLCEGLRNLAGIIATTSANRFASAVRLIDVNDALAESNVRRCPEIFDQYGDLLPLALEHVVAVNGEVRRPGAYPVVGETPVGSVIAVAGGLRREVDLTKVEVSHFAPNSMTGEVASQRGLVNIAAAAGSDTIVSPGDVIRFNPVFTDRDSGPVQLAGEFIRPGLYEIRRGERLSEVTARAGGLTEQAYPYGAVFTRERVRRAQQVGFQRAARELNSALAVAAVRQRVDVSSVLALQQVGRQLETVEALGRVVIEADPTVLQVRPELDVVLEPGDRIYMPKRPNFVSIIGDVLNPGALQFLPGTSAEKYIRQAGGFQRSADEDRVFVVYPNGVAEPIGVNPWNFSPVQIPPGSTIVVPKDPAPLDIFTLVREGSSIVSQLAVTAASLAVISRD